MTSTAPAVGATSRPPDVSPGGLGPRRRLLAAIAITAGLVLAACGDDDASPDATPSEEGASAEVEIRTFQFDPDPLDVAPGTAVTFTNNDSTTHTVTAGTRDDPTGEFDHELAQGESVTVTFDDAGTVEYFCALHSGPGMEGSVVVE